MAISGERFFQHGITTYVWNKLFRTEKLRSIQNNVDDSITMGEDSCVTFPYLYESKKISLINSPTYFYRQRAGSIIKTSEDNISELNRLDTLFECLIDQLSTHINRYNLIKQLKDYYVYLAITRTGGSISNLNLKYNLFLHGKIKKIALINSGSFGQMVFSELKNHDVEITNWVDEDYAQSKREGLPVSSFSILDKDKFDIALVASLNPSHTQSIIKKLKNQNIKEKQIRCVTRDSIESYLSIIKKNRRNIKNILFD